MDRLLEILRCMINLVMNLPLNKLYSHTIY